MMPEPEPTSETPSVARLQAWGREQLIGQDASRESELLLGHSLQRDRAWLYAHANDRVEAVVAQRFRQLIGQRGRGVPVAYLLGEWGFWTLSLQVTPDTLIPRPETELLVEAALPHCELDTTIQIADLGTGSGAIALALAAERPRARVLACDASAAALQVARANAKRNDIHNVEFRQGDWYAALDRQRCDLIVSNPPYIAASDPHLERGDLRFEPRSALASGDDGLDAIRVLVHGARDHLAPRGWLLLEHGCDQGAAVRALMLAAGLQQVSTLQDLEQRDRVSQGCAAG
jgi:release factor glutamine methyltransferase